MLKNSRAARFGGVFWVRCGARDGCVRSARGDDADCESESSERSEGSDDMRRGVCDGCDLCGGCGSWLQLTGKADDRGHMEHIGAVDEK